MTHGPNAKPILTARELEYVELVAQGLTDARIAERLFVTVKTVDVALRRIRAKVDAVNRAHLVRRGYDLGLLVRP